MLIIPSHLNSCDAFPFTANFPTHLQPNYALANDSKELVSLSLLPRSHIFIQFTRTKYWTCSFTHVLVPFLFSNVRNELKIGCVCICVWQQDNWINKQKLKKKQWIGFFDSKIHNETAKIKTQLNSLKTQPLCILISFKRYLVCWISPKWMIVWIILWLIIEYDFWKTVITIPDGVIQM